jgi:hypothetical protein
MAEATVTLSKYIRQAGVSNKGHMSPVWCVFVMIFLKRVKRQQIIVLSHSAIENYFTTGTRSFGKQISTYYHTSKPLDVCHVSRLRSYAYRAIIISLIHNEKRNKEDDDKVATDNGPSQACR